MSTIIHERVARARHGAFESVVCRMRSGFLVMGESQPVPGYCVLLPDPVPPHLNAMDDAHQKQFLSDMAAAGEHILAITEALRINYEILGNVAPALHAHIIPRYGDEPADKRGKSLFAAYDLPSLPPTDLALARPFMTKLRNALAGAGLTI